jgi:hypothetical protein
MILRDERIGVWQCGVSQEKAFGRIVCPLIGWRNNVI